MAANASHKPSTQILKLASQIATAEKNISVQRLSEQQIAAALKSHYTHKKNDRGNIQAEALQELLLKLHALSTDQHIEPISTQIRKFHPGVRLDPDDATLISYVDDCITEIFRQTDLDFRIEALIRDIAPLVVIEAMNNGAKSIIDEQPILALMDLLIEQSMGWSEDLGILGFQFMEKIETSVRALVTGRITLDQCFEELTGFYERENQVFEKMERKLCESTLEKIAGQNARYFSAALLNEKMAYRELPLFIIFLLQGSWYEFLQQVYNHRGPDSRSWRAVKKLTDLLIWSLQGTTGDAARQREVISKLPGRIKAFCKKMPFDTEPLEACLADIKAEYEAILAGDPSDPCDFELLPTDVNHTDNQRALNEKTRQSISKMRSGQWYLFDDKSEPEEKIARIKIILNRSDAQRILFTNHNRRKVMHVTYTKMTNYLETGTMQPLTLKSNCRSVIERFLNTVIQSIHSQKEKEIQTVARDEKKNLIREYLSKRQKAIAQRLKQQQVLAKKKHKRAQVLRKKAEQKFEAATRAVDSLKVEAWVNLPVMEGTLTPCKLVAIIPSSNTYIFTNRAGLKVGEFSHRQITQMIIAENSEILDTGAEFESVLASVITHLREGKSKSYDELSGNTEGTSI